MSSVAFWRNRDIVLASDHVSTFRGAGVEPDLVALPVGLRFYVRGDECRSAMSLPCPRRTTFHVSRRGCAGRATFDVFAGWLRRVGYVSTFRGDVAAARDRRVVSGEADRLLASLVSGLGRGARHPRNT